MTPSPPRPGCLAYLLFGLTALWIVGVTTVVQIGAWLADQLLLILADQPLPGWSWLLIALGHALALLVPAGLLALTQPHPRLRAAYQTWALAALFSGLLGLVRLFPGTWSQPAALAQTALALLFALGLWALRRIRPPVPGMASGPFPRPVLWLALALVPLVTAPALAWGALGSPLDSGLNLLAGLGLGLCAGLLLDRSLFQPLQAHSDGPGQDTAYGGLATGIALLVMGSGFGAGGTQLLLGLGLPALGFAAAGLARLARTDDHNLARAALPLTALIGWAAAAPLLFVDPEEMTLLLTGGEILEWALAAAGLTVLLAWGAGLAVWILGGRRLPTALTLPGAGLAWLAGLLLYLFVGQPGFHGEALFVILRDQADVSAAARMPEREARLRFVYDTLVAQADRTQVGLRARLDRLGIGYQPYYLVNALEVQAGPLLRFYLSRQPEVERVLDSPHLRPLPEPVAPARGSQAAPAAPPWNITVIGADRVWSELDVTGEGIVVGQSDSGVQGDHAALRDGYRGRGQGDDYNWLDPWNGTVSPTDIGGHGTHTLGTILGRGGIGVAPGAEWFGCVNLARNLGNPPVYLDCLQFMLAPYPLGGDPLRDGDPARAAHVLNNSWGCPPLEGCDPRALEPAVRALRAAGVFVVASAGNTGPGCGSVGDPLALYDDVFTVGASDLNGGVTGFSSRGPVQVDGSGRTKPDLLAPGGAPADPALGEAQGILSSFPGGTYEYAQGTSMAGPHVVGAVALIWSANPQLIGDIERTEQILIQSARRYTGPGGCGGSGGQSNDAGYGILDAYAAVQAALQLR